jgi:hypothetical protein
MHFVIFGKQSQKERTGAPSFLDSASLQKHSTQNKGLKDKDFS